MRAEGRGSFENRTERWVWLAHRSCQTQQRLFSYVEKPLQENLKKALGMKQRSEEDKKQKKEELKKKTREKKDSRQFGE